MSYINPAYLKGMADTQRAQFFADNTPTGWHPKSRDKFFIKTVDRYGGAYILGNPGNGKTSLIENMIHHDMSQNRSVILVDPHGDLIAKIIASLQYDKVPNVYELDMQDESHPFGLNVFSTPMQKTAVSLYQAIDKVMHIFGVLWPEVLDQQNAPRYLRASIITLFANHGSTLVDMYKLLMLDSYRQKLLRNVRDESVLQFWKTQYDDLSVVDKYTRVRPLLNRLEALFMGRSLVRNIVGQRENTIDFRKAIENKEIILIRLPLKTLLHQILANCLQKAGSSASG
jgi:hypothetical protein